MESKTPFLNMLKWFFVLLVLGGHVNAFQPFDCKLTTTLTRKGGPQSNIFRWKANHRRLATDYITYNYRVPSCYRKERKIQMQGWDGDDVRFISRLRRRLLRRRLRLDSSIRSKAKVTLIALQVAMYAYQIITTIVTIRRKFPSYWPNHGVEMILDSIWGSAVVNDPLTNTFGFSAAFSKAEIPYRYITSGLFHNGLLHLLINIGVMYQQPSWLADGLGGLLYLTTFFGSTITGNIAHVMNSSDRLFDVNLFYGSSAGICGLFGLMFVSLSRIANVNPSNGGSSSGQLLRGMAIMVFLGLWMDNVNTAINIGGFFGGVIIGIFCGPRYKKDYAMRRKNSAGYDPIFRDYRSVMGFGIMPTESGLIPLKALGSVLLTAVILIPKYRNVPLSIYRGLVNAV